MLNSSAASPGGIWVSKKLDEDAPVDSFVIHRLLEHEEFTKCLKEMPG